MAQSVFRSNEVTTKKDKVVLQFTKNFEPPKEETVEVVPEYTGPTADDLRREAEAFKESWGQQVFFVRVMQSPVEIWDCFTWFGSAEEESFIQLKPRRMNTGMREYILSPIDFPDGCNIE